MHGAKIKKNPLLPVNSVPTLDWPLFLRTTKASSQ